ncbi:MAG: NAD(P)H-dependent glycerol-3-phosphate dehydrogenase [Desulfomonilaceae bacterium]
MRLKRFLDIFGRHEGFKKLLKDFSGTRPKMIDMDEARNRALDLAEKYEPKGDRYELRKALGDLSVSFDENNFHNTASLLKFLTGVLFNDISVEPSPHIKEKIKQFKGPLFFFVNHSSYFDYAHTTELLNRLGLSIPVTHVSGSITTGWVSNWLKAFRTLNVQKTFSPVQHRAYSWFCAALAEAGEIQALYARTSRYTVRSRDGVLREPYVPHGVISGVKATGRALMIPVSISYSFIPEDSYLSSPWFFPVLSMFPKRRAMLIPFVLGLGSPEKAIKRIEGIFGDVATTIGEPFELTDDNSLSLQRISHLAVEEIARNKVIQPSQLVAKSLQGFEKVDRRTLQKKVTEEIQNTTDFFKIRYRKVPPFHPLITSDLEQAIALGLEVLLGRRAISRSVWRRSYSPRDESLLNFYAYHADRRIYPLRGRNTLTVVNAGAWGYTLALHIGGNLLKKAELSEHALILYDSREEIIEKLTVERKHPFIFKDLIIPRSVRPESDIIAAIGDTSLILLVTPSKYFYSTMIKILELAPEGSDLVIATKGFIPETGLLPCQTVRDELERLGKRIRISVLSGANLAHEIIRGGAGVTQIACDHYETFERLKPLIETRQFRVVYSGDVIGTTLAAALKNVYSIGYGILEGSKLAPENYMATYATLVTAEIRDFGALLGAAPETFDAESQVWMADLLATCHGGRSASFGRDLAQMDEKQGKGRPAKVLMEQYRKKMIAVEGFEASRFAQRIAAQRGFHPPILGEIYAILHGGKNINIPEFMEKSLDALKKREVSLMNLNVRTRTTHH